MGSCADRFAWERGVTADPGVVGERLAFLLVLATHWDRRTAMVTVTYEELAAELGRSTKTAQRHMDWATGAGWVTRLREGRRHVGASQYALALPGQQDTKAVHLTSTSAGQPECPPDRPSAGQPGCPPEPRRRGPQVDKSGASGGHLGVHHSELSEKASAAQQDLDELNALRSARGMSPTTLVDVQRAEAVIRGKVGPDADVRQVLRHLVDRGARNFAAFARAVPADELAQMASTHTSTAGRLPEPRRASFWDRGADGLPLDRPYTAWDA